MAREWFDSQGVDALVDVTGSAAGLAVNELAKARKKIVFYNSAATSRLTHEACGPFSVHYAFDTYALASGTSSAMVKSGFDTWFFVTVDYSFGHDLETDATSVVEKLGGKVLGSVKHPFNSPDFASQMRDDEAVPLICPTCQMVSRDRQNHPCQQPPGYFAWGCFRYF
jgi:branched-chain amino acid transport system substrate-binding protein